MGFASRLIRSCNPLCPLNAAVGIAIEKFSLASRILDHFVSDIVKIDIGNAFFPVNQKSGHFINRRVEYIIVFDNAEVLNIQA
jgi:hypothetical protein